MSFTDKIGTEWTWKLTDKVSAGLRQMVNLEKDTDKYFKQNTRSIADMERQLKNLENASKQTFNPDRIRIYNREIDKLQRNIKQAQGAGRSTMPQAGYNGFGALLPGFGAAFAVQQALAFGNRTANANLDWDKRIAKINATMQGSPEQRQKLSDDLLSLSQTYTGGNVTDVADSYEKIISQTNDAARAMDILKYSLKGARGGFTDLTTTGTALTSILENTKDQATTSAAVLDVLFKAKKVGAAEFDAFARYVPTQIASAQGLGFDYRDIAGLYAYTTTKIPNADVANTLVDNLIGQFKMPERVKEMRGLGISPFDRNNRARGLFPVLEDIKKGYDSAIKKGGQGAGANFLTAVTNDRQAGAALGQIIGDFDKLKATLIDVRRATGEADIQLKNADWGGSKIEEANRKWEKLAIDIGNLTAPIKIKLADAFSTFISGGVGSWAKQETGLLNAAQKGKAGYDANLGSLRMLKAGEYIDGNWQIKGGIPNAATQQALMSSRGFDPNGAGYGAGMYWNKPGARVSLTAAGAGAPIAPIGGALDKALGMQSTVITEKTPRIITVNIEKVGTDWTINSYDSGLNEIQIKDKLERALMDSIRDVEQGLGANG